MSKMQIPALETIRFENEDVIATSAQPYAFTMQYGSDGWIITGKNGATYEPVEGKPSRLNTFAWKQAGVYNTKGRYTSADYAQIDAGSGAQPLTTVYKKSTSNAWIGTYVFDGVATFVKQ